MHAPQTQEEKEVVAWSERLQRTHDAIGLQKRFRRQTAITEGDFTKRLLQFPTRTTVGVDWREGKVVAASRVVISLALA